MRRLHLDIEPGDISLSILPGQAHRRPARRFVLGRGIGQVAAFHFPTQPQDGIAGRGLVTAGAQKDEKLLAGDVELAQRESFHHRNMLRTFGSETAWFMRWASHQEFSRRHRNHLGTAGTFGKACALSGTGKSNTDQKREQAKSHARRCPLSVCGNGQSGFRYPPAWTETCCPRPCGCPRWDWPRRRSPASPAKSCGRLPPPASHPPDHPGGCP